MVFAIGQGLKAVVSVSGGDLRKAITTLQSVSTLYDEREINQDTIVEVAGVRDTHDTHTRAHAHDLFSSSRTRDYSPLAFLPALCRSSRQRRLSD